MAEELEIKLTVAEADQQKVEAWLSNDATAEYVGEKSLINRYFDTPAADLNRQKAALRVRQAGDKSIQTLKTRGEFVNGAHRRQEWEWPLPGPDLSLGLLADTPLADRVNLAELEVVFETNFQRRIWMIRQNGAEVEVVLDSGTVVSGDQSVALNEVEFELKAGNADVLMQLARELAGQVPVFLNLVSKAEQGYFLAGLYRPERVQADHELSVTEFLYQLSLGWLIGTSIGFSESALSQVHHAAVETKVEGLWQELRQEMASGKSVPELVRHLPRLGELQLALASVS
ncbi:CYTH domain-containing protein [Marinobacter sp. DUT-1]|uniref:CYTH domain-containing protein n=1 Tax=Marinobacter sp. DUT-1 TaxID=3412037 RepID=UPI003D170D84